MTKYYRVEPEVAGGWGPNTVATREPGKHPVVHRLHFQFDGWLGDELLESTPCFIITERLSGEIAKARLTGAVFDEVETTTSDVFEDLHPDRQLPRFLWLKVTGVPGRDDFGLSADMYLVVSEPALDLLRRSGIAHASVAPYE